MIALIPKMEVKPELRLAMIVHCPECGTRHDAKRMTEAPPGLKLICRNCYPNRIVVLWPVEKEKTQ